jgi:hypothetical protein
MSSLEKSEGANEITPSGSGDAGLSPAGMKAMQGETEVKTENPSDLKWKAEDGTAAHTIYERSVEDSLDDQDKDVSVYSNEVITLPDGQTGIIDTRVNSTIVDYKTHDMSNWKKADAIHFGHEHGQQVENYVNSPNTPTDAKGYIIAAGKPPADASVQQKYTDTLAGHGVDVKYPVGGEPEDIVTAVEKAVKENKLPKT